jgi:hypothetical protein
VALGAGCGVLGLAGRCRAACMVGRCGFAGF